MPHGDKGGHAIGQIDIAAAAEFQDLHVEEHVGQDGDILFGAFVHDPVKGVVADLPEVFDPQAGRMVKVNDLSAGKYDVTVTTGPSFSTLRQEAAEIYTQFAQQYPELMGVAGDLVMKSLDLPYADDIAQRLQTMLPPQIQEMINSDKEMSAGALLR